MPPGRNLQGGCVRCPMTTVRAPCCSVAGVPCACRPLAAAAVAAAGRTAARGRAATMAGPPGPAAARLGAAGPASPATTRGRAMRAGRKSGRVAASLPCLAGWSQTSPGCLRPGIWVSGRGLAHSRATHAVASLPCTACLAGRGGLGPGRSGEASDSLCRRQGCMCLPSY